MRSRTGLLSLEAWLLVAVASLGFVNAVTVTTVTESGATVTLPIIPATQISSLPTSCANDAAPVAPKQKALNHVRTTKFGVPSTPFGLVYADNDHAFVALPDGANSALGVLDTSDFTPKLIHQIPLPNGYAIDEGGLDVALSHDGRYVFVAAGPGAAIFDIAKAIAGSSDAAIGGLNGTSYSNSTGDEADSVEVAASIHSGAGLSGTQVTLTSDDEYAFVSQEYGSTLTGLLGALDVFKIDKGTADEPVKSTHVGFLQLGDAVVGSVLSPDGNTIYATSESQVLTSNLPGFISALDVAALKANNTKDALKSSVAAACGPVRAIVSSDGKTLWVTARESDLLLAYDTEKLISNPSESLLAKVTVGTAPVGLTFARNENLILTANSNRFNNTDATTGISVVDVKKALAGKGDKANLGQLATGLFPREFAVSPDGKTVLVADYDSKQIQTIDVSTLPLAIDIVGESKGWRHGVDIGLFGILLFVGVFLVL
ncbi:putative isomerase YbhE [Rhizodiscina lignyota]|uniref:Isomerase YbhE n=1 Tax=Rhizodiscina lignyota TaxID=1504668 RepID=A0A9P4IFG5_9PEZI|nr:putative isomerase YbhE [Rhizodiscina lignyota]